MDFGNAVLLVLLAAAPLALGIGLWTLRWRARQAGRMIRLGGGDVVRTGDARRRLLWLGALGLAVALLALAAARPQIGGRETEVRQTGVAVVVALDVSLSMGAVDADPNRLAVAQVEIGRLFERLLGDRVGLVIFGGDAFVRFPLTRDTRSAREIMDALEPGERFVPAGTNISAAIDAARSLLEESEAATRAILVVSDGESLWGDALLAAGEAAGAGVRVFAGGVGTAAGAMILVETRLGNLLPRIDRTTDEPIISRADLDALQGLSDAGRGRFVDLASAGALSSLADDFADLESTTFALTRKELPIERFQIFAAIALALLVLESFGPSLRQVWGRMWGNDRGGVRPAVVGLLALTIGLIASACASGAFSHNENGNAAYEAGEYEAALSEYRQAQADSPSERGLNLNAGRALHALGAFERAVSESARATESGDAMMAARAFFNLGNHRIAEGDLVAARNAYIESLLLDPSDFVAKFNLELVNAALALEPAPGTQESGSGPPGSGQESSGDPAEQGEGAEFGEESDSGSPGEPSEGDPSSAGDGSGQETIPGEAVPGGLGETPPEGEGEAAPSALEALQEALSELDREAPTRAQALAILDALRARSPSKALSLGQDAPITIDPGDR